MLKGTHVDVRHVLAADLPVFLPLFNDLESRGPHFSATFQSPERLKAEFALNGLAGPDLEHLAVTDKNGRLLGNIAHFKDRTPASREIGYRLFDQADAGRGYMSEALGLLIDHLFADRGFQRLQLLIAPENAASARMAARFGFTHEATLRQLLFRRGAFFDARVYSLLRAEWAAARHHQ